jgi:hypothetical protein
MFQRTTRALYLFKWTFIFFLCLFLFFMFVHFCACLREREEVSLLPIKVYVLRQQEAVFAILLCVRALGILFSFLVRFNELEGKLSHRP